MALRRARWPTLSRSKSCHYQACVAFFHEDEDRSEHGGLQGSLLCDSGMDRFSAHEDVLFGGLRMIPECLSGKEELNTVYSLNSKSPFERRNAHDVVHTRGFKRCPIAQNMIQESFNGN